jgi:hypothetical protein
LQRNGGVHRQRSGAASTFGIDDGEDPGLSAAASFAARGRVACERFQQPLGSRHAIDELASPGAHRANNGHGVAHFADSENRDVIGCGADQFDGTNCTLRVVRVDIDQYDFGVLILNLADDGICCADGKANIAEHGAGNVGAFQTILKNDRLLAVLG